MPMTRSFDVVFDLRLNKRLSKESWGRWFEMLSRPLWRHCNAIWLWWQSSLAFIITRINMFKTKFVLSSARPQASEECSLISTSLCSTAKSITTLAPKIPPIDVGWQQWNYSGKYLPANHTRASIVLSLHHKLSVITYIRHSCDIRWMSSYLKSLTTWLFVQQFVQANIPNAKPCIIGSMWQSLWISDFKSKWMVWK